MKLTKVLKLFIFFILAWEGSTQAVRAQTTISGHVSSLGGNTIIPTNTFVRFRLRNYAGNIPRLTGTGVCVAGAVLPLRSGGAIYYDVVPNASTGAISGTVCGNDVITPTNTFYSVELWANGITTGQQNFLIVGGTFNLDTQAPLTTAPTPPPPGSLAAGSIGDLSSYNNTNTLADSGIASANVVTLAGTQTLTNKNLTSPTSTGTDSGSETLSNKTLSDPIINGNISAFSTKSAPYTLTSSDSWVNVTGTTTITVPHALTGQRWHLHNNGVNLVTIAPDSGTLNGAASIFIQPSVGVELTCDGTNCQASVSSTNGFPSQVTEVNLTAQNNNIGATTLYSVPTGGAGLYRANCYTVVTTAAGTSSTLPNCVISFTDSDTNDPEGFGITHAEPGNGAGTSGNQGSVSTPWPGVVVFKPKISTVIQYSTLNYASNPANAMQYSVYIRLEYLGP
jgi:hypothetical protein